MRRPDRGASPGAPELGAAACPLMRGFGVRHDGGGERRGIGVRREEIHRNPGPREGAGGAVAHGRHAHRRRPRRTAAQGGEGAGGVRARHHHPVIGGERTRGEDAVGRRRTSAALATRCLDMDQGIGGELGAVRPEERGERRGAVRRARDGDALSGEPGASLAALVHRTTVTRADSLRFAVSTRMK